MTLTHQAIRVLAWINGRTGEHLIPADVHGGSIDDFTSIHDELSDANLAESEKSLAATTEIRLTPRGRERSRLYAAAYPRDLTQHLLLKNLYADDQTFPNIVERISKLNDPVAGPIDAGLVHKVADSLNGTLITAQSGWGGTVLHATLTPQGQTVALNGFISTITTHHNQEPSVTNNNFTQHNSHGAIANQGNHNEISNISQAFSAPEKQALSDQITKIKEAIAESNELLDEHRPELLEGINSIEQSIEAPYARSLVKAGFEAFTTQLGTLGAPGLVGLIQNILST